MNTVNKVQKSFIKFIKLSQIRIELQTNETKKNQRHLKMQRYEENINTNQINENDNRTNLII